MYKLPKFYNKLSISEKQEIRAQYIKEQKGLCFYCGETLDKPAPERITNKKINWELFPESFLGAPIHLQHDHKTGLTEGAVHNYCNAVMWQYEGR